MTRWYQHGFSSGCLRGMTVSVRTASIFKRGSHARQLPEAGPGPVRSSAQERDGESLAGHLNYRAEVVGGGPVRPPGEERGAARHRGWQRPDDYPGSSQVPMPWRFRVRQREAARVASGDEGSQGARERVVGRDHFGYRVEIGLGLVSEQLPAFSYQESQPGQVLRGDLCQGAERLTVREC